MEESSESVAGIPRYRISQKGITRTLQLTKTFLEFIALENVMVGRVYGRKRTYNLKAAADESISKLVSSQRDYVRALKEKIRSQNGDQLEISVGERGLRNWPARISRFRMAR
ncbi:MAG: hypothetical protein P8189_03925 [Anaerolineae bacterium]|jgi:ABC-type branched-subunit amino acid transport system ATPase component